MWPFSKKKQPIGVVDELIEKAAQLAKDDPDGWRFKKIGKVFHWFYKDSCIFITHRGDIGTEIANGQTHTRVCVARNDKQRLKLEKIENDLAAHRALRTLLREEM